MSRQMGFVGFKSESDAAAALKYYNNTYIDAMKISVEVRHTHTHAHSTT